MGQNLKSKDTKWVVIDGDHVRIGAETIMEGVEIMNTLIRQGPPRTIAIMPKEEYLKSDLTKTKRGKRS